MDLTRNLTLKQQEAFRRMSARSRNKRLRLLAKLPYTFTVFCAAARWKKDHKEAAHLVSRMLKEGEITTLNPGKVTHPQIYKKWD